MKFKLIVEYDANDDDYNLAEDGDSPSASTHSTSTEHPHINRSFGSTLIYTIMSGLTRGTYMTYELPLVDIPDDLLFQFMVMGIQDGDYIAYNYATDRIVIANRARDARSYAARVNDDDELYTWRKRGYGGVKASNYNANSTTMIDFNIPDDDNSEYDYDAEEIVFDLKDIYSDVFPKLKPYLMHKFVSDYNVFGNWYDRWMKPIGPSTSGFSYRDEPVAESADFYSNGERTIIKMQCPIPREDILFMFKQFMDNGKVFTECRSDLKNMYVEKMRQITVDIMTKCSEKTGTEWDFK